MTLPTPPPLTIYRIESYQDNRGRIVLAKWVTIKDGAPLNLADLHQPTFIGQGVAGVNTPHGIQQVPFEIPLPGPTIADAFAQFDAHQEPAWKVHMDKLRLQAMRQGADLTQLPTSANGKPR